MVAVARLRAITESGLPIHFSPLQIENRFPVHEADFPAQVIFQQFLISDCLVVPRLRAILSDTPELCGLPKRCRSLVSARLSSSSNFKKSS
jgi:hypothetical protein